MRAIVLTLCVAFLAGCNGNDLVSGAGVFGGDDNGPDINQPWNPHDSDGDGDPDDVGPPTTDPQEWDDDGDGIPDVDDYIPCKAIYIKVWNHDVSSAEITLNGQVIVDSSTFPTTAVIVEFINPTPGVNTLTAGGKVTGSPGDELHMEIWDTNGVLYMHETAIRGHGTPETWSAQFLIDVQC